MALSLILAHYPEGINMEEVTAGFPSETGEFDMAEVLQLMALVQPYTNRVLAVADLESHTRRARRLLKMLTGTKARRTPMTSLPIASSMPPPRRS
jgi:hypothetical protein